MYLEFERNAQCWFGHYSAVDAECVWDQRHFTSSISNRLTAKMKHTHAHKHTPTPPALPCVTVRLLVAAGNLRRTHWDEQYNLCVTTNEPSLRNAAAVDRLFDHRLHAHGIDHIVKKTKTLHKSTRNPNYFYSPSPFKHQKFVLGLCVTLFTVLAYFPVV